MNARAGARRQQYLDARDQLTRAESELAEVERNLEELELKTRAGAEEAITKHIADLAELVIALASEQRRAGRSLRRSAEKRELGP